MRLTLFVQAGISIWIWLAVFITSSQVAKATAIPSPSHQKTAVLGVLAYRGDKHARKVWTPTLVYLNKVIPDVKFHLRTLTLPQIYYATKSHELDFVLTNPGNYVELEAKFGISRIVTLESAQQTQGINSGTGSAVIVLHNRSDLQNLTDLRGKSVMAVSKHAFGGFQAAWRQFNSQGLDPFKDFEHLAFNGFPQDDIAYAVLNGQVDAGILRICVLENMAREGKIKRESFRVLNPRPHESSLCEASTRLYPDWPLAKLRETPNRLAKRVAQALLAMPATSPAARSSHHTGWTIPMDYLPVHELFKELQIGPYRWLRQTPLEHLWQRYWQWIVILVSTILWGIWHMARVEHLVKLRTKQLSDTNDKLNGEIQERQRAEEKARQHQAELAHVSRVSTVGELASGMAHEINQPLFAINNYAQGCNWRLQANDISNEELIDINQHVIAQAERAGAIIQRYRNFLRKESVTCTNVDINEAIHEALAFYSSEARTRGLAVKLDLAERLPPVCSELIQLEQVLLNIIRNAAEAMQEVMPEKRILEIRSSVEDNNRIIIKLRDHGLGISKQAEQQLFDPFFTTKADGMGLGLCISRSIIESQGGRISVQNHAPQGVTFTITLPIYKGENSNEQ